MTKHFIIIILLFMTCIISSYGIFMAPQTSFGVNLTKPITEDTLSINQGDKYIRIRGDLKFN